MNEATSSLTRAALDNARFQRCHGWQKYMIRCDGIRPELFYLYVQANRLFWPRTRQLGLHRLQSTSSQLDHDLGHRARSPRANMT